MKKEKIDCEECNITYVNFAHFYFGSIKFEDVKDKFGYHAV